MLFINVFTYKPEEKGRNRKEICRKVTDGHRDKLIGEWVVIGGGQIFRLFEADDPKAMTISSLAWSDLGETDFMPVMASEEVMRLVPGKK